MAKKIPLTSCTPRHMPRSDPKFHILEILDGAGRSIIVLDRAFKIGLFFLIFIGLVIILF
jgi:hypothetical protein